MNLEELKTKLEQEPLLKNKYFIGRPSDNKYCIVFENNEWLTFYFERGQRTRLKIYTTELAACTAFYESMMIIKERKERLL